MAETYTSWLALPVAGYWVTAQGCVCRLCVDLNRLRPGGSVSVTKCALEESCRHVDALYFTFTFYFKRRNKFPAKSAN